MEHHEELYWEGTQQDTHAGQSISRVHYILIAGQLQRTHFRSPTNHRGSRVCHSSAVRCRQGLSPPVVLCCDIRGDKLFDDELPSEQTIQSTTRRDIRMRSKGGFGMEECSRTGENDRLGRESVIQVSHHPPAAAHYAEGDGWTLTQDFTMTSRFRGKYLSVVPVGYTHIAYPGTTNHYTYKKVGIHTSVHSIITDHYHRTQYHRRQTMDRQSWRHGDTQSWYRGSRPCQVPSIQLLQSGAATKGECIGTDMITTCLQIYGVISDKRGVPRYVIQGFWDRFVDLHRVTSYSGKADKMKLELSEPGERIWTINERPPGSERMHNFR